MQVKSPDILSAVEAIGEHYRTNIANRFTRRALSAMILDQSTWGLIEELTEKAENYRYQGYHLDELYGQILAMGRFVSQARKELVPNIRRLVPSSSEGAREGAADKVLRDMAVANFGANLKILADKVNDLYMKTAAIDKAAAGAKRPVFDQIPELKELGRYLVG
jgi:hypothetical protein